MNKNTYKLNKKFFYYTYANVYVIVLKLHDYRFH